MPELPRGTVAFLFTDIEGSTRLWHAHPDPMRAAYTRHDALLRAAISEHQGVVYKVIGDAMQAAFPTAAAAVAAAIQAQIALAAEDWGAVGLPERLRVRLALHAGAVDPTADGDYRSPVLNRIGRLLGAGHGGQILLSRAVVELLAEGLPPGATPRDLGEHHLKDLTPEHIWQVRAPNLPADFPPLAARRPENLPLPPTPLVGREAERAEVVALLDRAEGRLVTLLGPGGIGKTRLGLAVAAATLAGFGEGAFFVPLATVTDPALVPAMIAASLGLQEQAGRPPPEMPREHLRDRHLLLVLDNLEQVVAAAPSVAELLAACPRLAVLATSRTPLGLRGERQVPVPPLAVPAAEVSGHLTPERAETFAAVRLFAARAEAVTPGFRLTEQNTAAVAAICRRLDGLPLAIELAAARTKLFPPAALLARLEQRLPLLTGGARDLPARHQTPRATIAWSYDLLAPPEQALFRRLAAFAGGCTLEAAAAVAGPDGADVIDGVAALVDHSMLRREAEAGGEPRLSMLETIREFGWEQLGASGEREAVRQRHAAFFMALTAEIDATLRGSTPGPAYEPSLAQLAAEHENVLAALGFLFNRGDSEDALRLAADASFFWDRRGYLTVGRGWLDRVLAGLANVSDARADATLWAGIFAVHASELPRATELLHASLRMFQSLGNENGAADAMSYLGFCAAAAGDLERAATILEAALASRRESGHQAGTVAALANLASIYVDREEYERAAALLEEAFGLAEAHGEALGAAHALLNLSELALRRGDRTLAVVRGRQCLTRWWAPRDQWGVGACFNVLGRGLAAARPAEAARLLGMEEALREMSGIALPLTYQTLPRAAADTIRTALGEPAFTAAWTAGRALPLDEAVAEALTADETAVV